MASSTVTDELPQLDPARADRCGDKVATIVVTATAIVNSRFTIFSFGRT
jgi:hypothetical protein